MQINIIKHINTIELKMDKSKIRKKINPYYKPGNVFERDVQYYEQNLVFPSKEIVHQESER